MGGVIRSGHDPLGTSRGRRGASPRHAEGQPTFFKEEDYRAYLGLMAAACAEHGLSVPAWCLMPNLVHLIGVPDVPQSLALAIGRAHGRYTRAVNFRENWRGYLWQGRFSSCPMDAAPTPAAARYVERNPVRAGLVKRAWDWAWSSAAAYVEGGGDRLLASGGPLVAEVKDWRRFLGQEEDEEDLRRLRRHGRTGWPLGSHEFVTDMERLLARILALRKPGPRAPGEQRLGVCHRNPTQGGLWQVVSTQQAEKTGESGLVLPRHLPEERRVLESDCGLEQVSAALRRMGAFQDEYQQ
jgi:putative transposase